MALAQLCYYLVAVAATMAAPDPVIPHAQDRPPGPALSPADAMTKMTLPEGFEVKLFASEPDLVNPVAMTFDDRGRVWVTESVEYPRRPAGKGRDRVKILEDTDGDGKADKVTTFADDLNIPSGIAVGDGGVYVGNSPDILFLRDTDGDDVADQREVLLTGFGRDDTHELPNCFTWGPDGWLYGLNGVFNPSTVTYKGKTHRFTCALWRYHPGRELFELFCEGTSNPWGLDYDSHGSFFVSACVIDHLWHLTQTGYYHRQAGAYPPYTWKIESIVDHKHQKAAYCGLCYYDADAYPADFRGKLFMGNIHGNCINVDALERNGSSYLATGRPDFLSANDAWFMPVVQKVGPDGCLWVLDWYDRYHCYQDANRDPAGIDRLKGRLYRVTYRGTPMAKPFDLAKQSNDELLAHLGNPNVYYRRTARRLLVERGGSDEQLVNLAKSANEPARTEALWTIVSRGNVPAQFHEELLSHADPKFRAWGVRAAAEAGSVDSVLKQRIVGMVDDPAPDVQLQLAIAARRIKGVDAIDVLHRLLAKADADTSELLPRIIWRNLEPLVEGRERQIAERLTSLANVPALNSLLPRILERSLAGSDDSGPERFDLLGYLLRSATADTNHVVTALDYVADARLSGRLNDSAWNSARRSLRPMVKEYARLGREDAKWNGGYALGVLLEEDDALTSAASFLADRQQTLRDRRRILLALAQARPDQAVAPAIGILTAGMDETDEMRAEALTALSRMDDARVGTELAVLMPTLSGAMRPQTLDVLTSRPAWSKALLDAVADKKIAATDVNVNQLKKMLAFKDAEIAKRVEGTWGKVRTERAPNREGVLRRMRGILSGGEGDAGAGAKVFERVCAQCHRFQGKGYAVGPDITDNGRSSLDQLLSNLLDPNLVIGKDYQARVVATDDGRIVTGLVIEDSPQRVVLKIAGAKEEVFDRSSIDEFRDSAVSLMPEDLEKQVNEQEFRDLIKYLLIPSK